MFLKHLLILFLGAPAFHRCMQAFSSCRELGLLFIAVASLVAEHRLWVRELQQLWHTGLVALWHVESSWIRGQACILCIGRWILTHCTTKEVPEEILFSRFSYLLAK